MCTDYDYSNIHGLMLGVVYIGADEPPAVPQREVRHLPAAHQPPADGADSPRAPGGKKSSRALQGDALASTIKDRRGTELC